MVSSPLRTSFNSRTREGCDEQRHRGLAKALCFNSRTREGFDRLRSILLSSKGGFNSRTREGCDYQLGISKLEGLCFNSRTREGCDFAGSLERVKKEQFQFTHPRGVRLALLEQVFGASEVSIHAPARGATQHTLSKQRHLTGFNSRTREGCDLPCPRY